MCFEKNKKNSFSMTKVFEILILLVRFAHGHIKLAELEFKSIQAYIQLKNCLKCFKVDK